MAEGRRDRSARRRRKSGEQQPEGGRAWSDSELAQVEGRRGRRPAPQPPATPSPQASPYHSPNKCLLHEGLDVDQLARYRRRRVLQRPPDHLCLDNQTDAQLDGKPPKLSLLTEYKLAFRASSDDIFRDTQEPLSPLKTKRQSDENSSGHKRDGEKGIFAADPRSSDHVPLSKSKGNLENKKTVEDSSSPYATQNDIDFGRIMEMGTDVLKRPPPIRRPTTLHHGLGDFSRTTEYSNFVPFVGVHRPELRRRGTSLRMEGEFEGRSEKEEQFVEWPKDSLVRPRPFRLPTNLRLEGEMQVSTECRDKYVPFVGTRRPDLLKQSAQLTVEGDSSWTPEYQRVFKQYHCPGSRKGSIESSDSSSYCDSPISCDIPPERSVPKIPVPNLKAGAPGGFFDGNEGTGFLPHTEDKEADLMDELMRDIDKEEEEKRRREEEDEKNMNEEEEDENSQRKEEEMRLLVSKLENLKGPPLEVPEYKASFKDFPRERPKLMRPEDEIGRADGTKVTSPSPVRFKTKIDQDPEYKSIFLDPAYRERHFFQRPGPSFRPSNCSSGRNSFFRVSAMDNRVENGSAQNSSRRESRAAPMSEIRSQYVDYGQVPRVESLRMPSTLRLEGNIEMEPEYRDAFCQPSQPSQPRRRERSLSASRRRESSSSQLVPAIPNGNANGGHWADNNNGEIFGAVNAADEQDAFQVLHTRLHEESVVGKPPPGSSRRNSRYSLPRASMQSDITSTAGIEKQPEQQQQQPRVRSPSPSGPFRLQVSHADDEPRGFIARRSRRSPSQNLLVRSSSDRSPSPIQHAPERPYSPSFARDASAEGRQAFVVLDEGGLNDVAAPAPSRRRRTDRNVDPRDSVTSLRGCNGTVPKPRNRTPPNWMPPWYDSSTSTI